MSWDDLRYVLALVKAGSLSKAAKALNVDHTTVGRRVEAIEAHLGVSLFTRTHRGLVPTAEAERLLPSLRDVEAAVLAFDRAARAQNDRLEGVIRVTSGESFGISYLAPRLAALGRQHPGLTIELDTGGSILDLARQEADIAVRFFRTDHDSLVVRRVAELAHGLYASEDYLARNPVLGRENLRDHAILTATGGGDVVEAAWVARITEGARPTFVSNMTLGLLEAVKAGAGIGVLPRYLGDREPTLRHLPQPDEPREGIWLTVHRDLQHTRRLRIAIDYLVACFTADRTALLGSAPARA